MKKNLTNTNNDIKIEVYEGFSFLRSLLFCIVFLGFAFCNIMQDNYYDNSNIFSQDNIILYSVIATIIGVFIYEFFNKREYISYFLINDYEIQIVHKIRNKISEIKTINKNHIKNFLITATVDFDFKHSYTKYDLSIELTCKENIFYNQLNARSEDFIFKLIEISSEIPNFKLNLKSNSETFKQKVESYKNTGKKYNFVEQEKMHFEGSDPIIKAIIILFCIILAMFFVSLII